MPFDKSKYPPYWPQFSRYIRYERAKNKCERCGTANGAMNERGSRTVLTVAHLDGKSRVCFCLKRYGLKCSKPEHVLALCQSCHLSEDREKHAAVRRKNLVRKKDLSRGLFNL